jgi:hypothetical protein
MRGQRSVSLGAASIVAISLLADLAAQAAAPVVSNVRASQRAGSKFADLYYQLSDGDSYEQAVHWAFISAFCDFARLYKNPNYSATDSQSIGRNYANIPPLP